MNKDKKEGRGRSGPKNTRLLEPANVLQQDRTPVFALGPRSHRGILQRPLHRRGARAGVGGEVEGRFAADVRGGH